MRRRADIVPSVPGSPLLPAALFKLPPVEPFRTIVADPGWPYGDKLPGSGRGASKNYGTMTVDTIARFLESFAMMMTLGAEWPEGVIAKDARLFLWRVHPMQAEALQVMKAWGFGEPVSELVWAKVDKDVGAVVKAIKAQLRKQPTGLSFEGQMMFAIEEARRLTFGMGRTFRAAHEVCLVGRRGRPELLSKSERTVFFAPVREHSQKPEEFFEIVERVSPGPYLELFSGGHTRSGWTCLGASHREEPTPA